MCMAEKMTYYKERNCQERRTSISTLFPEQYCWRWRNEQISSLLRTALSSCPIVAKDWRKAQLWFLSSYFLHFSNNCAGKTEFKWVSTPWPINVTYFTSLVFDFLQTLLTLYFYTAIFNQSIPELFSSSLCTSNVGQVDIRVLNFCKFIFLS